MKANADICNVMVANALTCKERIFLFRLSERIFFEDSNGKQTRYSLWGIVLMEYESAYGAHSGARFVNK